MRSPDEEGVEKMMQQGGDWYDDRSDVSVLYLSQSRPAYADKSIHNSQNQKRCRENRRREIEQKAAVDETLKANDNVKRTSTTKASSSRSATAPSARAAGRSAHASTATAKNSAALGSGEARREGGMLWICSF